MADPEGQTETPAGLPGGFLSIHQAVDAQLAEDSDQEHTSNDTEPTADDQESDDVLLSEEEDSQITDDDLSAPSDDEEEVVSEFSEDSDQDLDEDEYSDDDIVAFELEDGTQVSLREAQRGFLRESDYTRKTQALAVKDKETDEARDKYLAEQQRYIDSLKLLEEQLEADDPFAGQNIDWAALKEEDPVVYLQAKEHQRERAARLQKAKDEREQAEKDQQTELLNKARKTMAKEAEALAEAFPEWQDKEIAARDKAKMEEYLLAQGVSEQEISNIRDHRFMKVLRDALAGAELRKKKPMAKKKLSRARPMLKRGGGQQRRRKRTDRSNSKVQNAEKRLSQVGDIDSAVDLQMERFNASRRS